VAVISHSGTKELAHGPHRYFSLLESPRSINPYDLRQPGHLNIPFFQLGLQCSLLRLAVAQLFPTGRLRSRRCASGALAGLAARGMVE
jgi:hypothetical protein